MTKPNHFPPHTPRVWVPIPGTRHRECCAVSDSVRVVRETLLFLPPGKRFQYEVQEQHPSGEWLLTHDMMLSARVAFRKAEALANARRREVRT